MATTTPVKVTRKAGILPDLEPAVFITAYAKYLKRSGNIVVPKWADLVKTGHHKELAPSDRDWFYVRAATIARRLYLDRSAGSGVGIFRRMYGGRVRRGSKPNRFVLGSGAVIRAVIQELEKMKIIEKSANGGRKISSHGRSELDKIAGNVINGVSKRELNKIAMASKPATEKKVPAKNAKQTGKK